MVTVTSWASTPASAKAMRANRSRDTKPELNLRRLLHAAGCRYRVDFPPVPGLRRRADVVFTKRRVAVFVDGCFWHGCPEHATLPTANADYWLPKLARNIERDRETNRLLADAGWRVLRFWEHQSPESMSHKVLAALDRNIDAVP
jgi:DNA mismatch endonuclease (patch repair protein)